MFCSVARRSISLPSSSVSSSCGKRLSERDDLVLKLGRDPVLAHQSLFRHRHEFATPPFHYELIKTWRSAHPRVNTMAFRAAGKRTIAEAALCLMPLYGRSHNCLLVRPTEHPAT